MPRLKVGMVYCRTGPYLIHANEGALSTLGDIVEKHPDMDIIIAPEWYFISKKGIYGHKDYKKIRSSLEELTEGNDMLLVPGSVAWEENKVYKNTSPVLSGGKVILEYDKRTDGGDMGYASRNNILWKPGRKRGTFSWRGNECGIEICSDHLAGTLRKADKAKDLDLQVIVAAGGFLQESSSAVREGGYILLSDGVSPEAEVFQKKKGQYVLQKGVSEEVIDPDRKLKLREYVLDFEDK